MNVGGDHGTPPIVSALIFIKPHTKPPDRYVYIYITTNLFTRKKYRIADEHFVYFVFNSQLRFLIGMFAASSVCAVFFCLLYLVTSVGGLTHLEMTSYVILNTTKNKTELFSDHKYQFSNPYIIAT